MDTKRKLIALHDFNDRMGKIYKKDERFEADPNYAVELIRRGDANDDPDAGSGRESQVHQQGEGKEELHRQQQETSKHK